MSSEIDKNLMRKHDYQFSTNTTTNSVLFSTLIAKPFAGNCLFSTISESNSKAIYCMCVLMQDAQRSKWLVAKLCAHASDLEK